MNILHASGRPIAWALRGTFGPPDAALSPRRAATIKQLELAWALLCGNVRSAGPTWSAEAPPTDELWVQGPALRLDATAPADRVPAIAAAEPAAAAAASVAVEGCIIDLGEHGGPCCSEAVVGAPGGAAPCTVVGPALWAPELLGALLLPKLLLQPLPQPLPQPLQPNQDWGYQHCNHSKYHLEPPHRHPPPHHQHHSVLDGLTHTAAQRHAPSTRPLSAPEPPPRLSAPEPPPRLTAPEPPPRLDSWPSAAQTTPHPPAAPGSVISSSGHSSLALSGTTGAYAAGLPSASRGGAAGLLLRCLTTGDRSSEGISRELMGCTTVEELRDAVSLLWDRMRPLHHALTVTRLGQLARGRGAQRAAARHLAWRCTDAALGAGSSNTSTGPGGSSSIDMEALKLLLQGWVVLKVPHPEHLASLLEALVPGAAATSPAAALRNHTAQHQQQHQRDHLGSQSGAEPTVRQQHRSPAVRKEYGRLHMATLSDISALAGPLAKLGALSQPLRDVIANVAVRRAGYEEPAELAAAALVFCKVGVADSRVAGALLDAAVALPAGAGGVTARQLAAVLRLCAKAGYYKPSAFAAAAEALVTLSVGELDEQDVAAVLRSFAGGQHAHAMLLSALAMRARAFALAATAGHGAVTSPSTTAAAAAVMESDGDGGGRSRGRELNTAINSVSAMVQGFRVLQVDDPELYGTLAEAAVRLFREASGLAAAAAGADGNSASGAAGAGAGSLANERVMAAALAALVEGLAAVRVYPGGVLAEMTVLVPGLVRYMKESEILTLTCSLAELRHRDEQVMEALDRQVARFLIQAASATGPASATSASKASTGRGGGWGGSAAPADDGASSGALGVMTWLPVFLEAACRGLSYPCHHTYRALLGPAVRVSAPGGGGGCGAAVAEVRAPSMLRLLLAAGEADITPQQVCGLMGAMACAGALQADGAAVRVLARALARSLVPPQPSPPPSRPPAGSSPAAKAKATTMTAAAATLDDAAACDFFRAFIVASDAGLAEALQDELPLGLAAPLLSRAANAWHAAGLGTAAPLALMEDQPARQRRRRLGIDAAPSQLLSELLKSLQLVVFGPWESSDGCFRVARGVAVADVMVGVEVLPDRAFAANGGNRPVMVGDAAFRARCLAARGWRLVALPGGEWAAAERAGPAACMQLLLRRREAFGAGD